jgi:hypothetical protein
MKLLPLFVIACTGSSEPDPPKLLDTGWFTDTAALATNPETCPHRFQSSVPAGGESNWYWRDRPVLFTDTNATVNYDAWLVDADGNRLDTQIEWRDGDVSFDLVWDGLFEPSTEYTLWTRDCAGTESVSFRTSALGAPLLDGPDGLVGTTFRLDLVGATWVEPAALSGILAIYFTTPILLGVQYADDSNIDFLGAAGDVDELGRIKQSTAPTWDFPVQSFAQQPYFEAEVDFINLDYVSDGSTTKIPVQDFRLFATIAADASSLGGAKLSGLADTRNMGALLSDAGNLSAICDFARPIGVDCVDCADGLPYCLYLEASDLVGTRVSDVTLVPR